MLGKPLNIEEFGLDNLKGAQITGIETDGGTYGMGGPGFFDIKFQGEFGTRWLSYCIWNAGEHILIDGNVLECHPNYAEQYKPLISFDDYHSSLEAVKSQLINATIDRVTPQENSFEIRLTGSDSVVHTIQSFKFSEKFPEQGGTGKKRNSYEKGQMKDYLLVIYDKTYLKV